MLSSFFIKKNQVHAVIGVLMDDTDPLVTVMKVEKAPQETYADIGGLDNQIQEIKVFILPTLPRCRKCCQLLLQLELSWKRERALLHAQTPLNYWHLFP